MKAPFFRPATRARKKKNTHTKPAGQRGEESSRRRTKGQINIQKEKETVLKDSQLFCCFFFLFSSLVSCCLLFSIFVLFLPFFFFFHKEKKSGVFFFLDREGEGLARNNIHTPHITSNSSKQQQQKKKDESNNNNNNN